MTGTTPPKIIGVIPARYGGIRFPGKPLSLILGKTLIQRTYESARKCSLLEALIVATDDRRIYDHVRSFGGEVSMTSTECPTGTDRIVEAIKQNGRYSSASVILNIQGDEPCIESHVISAVANELIRDPEAVMSTAVVKLESASEASNPSVVKCVINQRREALYFSRTLIPSGKTAAFRNDVTYYGHLGIYGYRRDFLFRYAELPVTPLQSAEDLEQLKVLELGYSIKVAIVNSCNLGVDVPEDIKKVERFLCKQNLSL